MSPPAIAVLGPEQLTALVREAVSAELAEMRLDTGPLILDRSGIARALGVSPSTIDRLRREGLPCVWLGDSPRFVPDECLAWLRQNRRDKPPEQSEPG